MSQMCIYCEKMVMGAHDCNRKADGVTLLDDPLSPQATPAVIDEIVQEFCRLSRLSVSGKHSMEFKNFLAARLASHAPAAPQVDVEAQKAKRMNILLDENCIETIKRLTPQGGEEIFFGGVMGGVRLLWSGSPAAAPVGQPWLTIETAPKDGKHILAADFNTRVGFGGDQNFYQCVVHWWQWAGGTHQDEWGWYPSTGAGENPALTNLTHWKPLETLRESFPQGWVRVEDGLPEDDSDVFVAIWWVNPGHLSRSRYEIHDCSYYEGGELPDGSQQKIFSDCEGEEFEPKDVAFWIYKRDLAAQFPAPPAAQPGEDGKK